MSNLVSHLASSHVSRCIPRFFNSFLRITHHVFSGIEGGGIKLRISHTSVKWQVLFLFKKKKPVEWSMSAHSPLKCPFGEIKLCLHNNKSGQRPSNVDTPVPLRSLKLSKVGSGQYYTWMGDGLFSLSSTCSSSLRSRPQQNKGRETQRTPQKRNTRWCCLLSLWRHLSEGKGKRSTLLCPCPDVPLRD